MGGLEVMYVYDNGSLFEPAVLAISADDIIGRFKNGAKNVAAVSIELGKPCVASRTACSWPSRTCSLLLALRTSPSPRLQTLRSTLRILAPSPSLRHLLLAVVLLLRLQ